MGIMCPRCLKCKPGCLQNRTRIAFFPAATTAFLVNLKYCPFSDPGRSGPSCRRQPSGSGPNTPLSSLPVGSKPKILTFSDPGGSRPSCRRQPSGSGPNTPLSSLPVGSKPKILTFSDPGGSWPSCWRQPSGSGPGWRGRVLHRQLRVH